MSRTNSATLFDKNKSYVIATGNKLPSLDSGNLYNFNLGDGITEDENGLQLNLSDEFKFSDDGSVKINSDVVKYIISTLIQFNSSTYETNISWSGDELCVDISKFAEIVKISLVNKIENISKEYLTSYNRTDDLIYLTMPDFIDYDENNWFVKIVGVAK